MFIERAEGFLHLRDLYLEAGIECPTQLALAEQLTRDGYPVSQSQISRMLQTVDWLLPCIPNALYGGLTRKIIDRLLALRSAAEQVWAKLMPLERQPEFADLFSTALATFNGEPEGVVPQLVQDELLGEMSCRSGMSWNTLLAELTDGQSKRQALLGPPTEKVLWPPPPETEKAALPEPEPPTEPAAPDEPRSSPLVHTARSLCACWGLDAFIQPDDSAPAGFTLAPCHEFPHPAAQRCYQVLAALNGDTSTPISALELLLSPDYDNAQIQQLIQLISLCRHPAHPRRRPAVAGSSHRHAALFGITQASAARRRGRRSVGRPLAEATAHPPEPDRTPAEAKKPSAGPSFRQPAGRYPHHAGQ